MTEEKQMKRTFGEALENFFLWIWSGIKALFIALFRGITGIFTGAYKGIILLGKSIKKNAIAFVENFKNGDYKTRTSYFIMGFGCLANRQIVKGAFYLIIEIGFALFMVFSGGQAIVNFITLGVNQGTPPYEDPNTGMIVPGTPPDDSMRFLLFGIGTILIILLFIAFYFAQLKTAVNNQEIIKKGKGLPTFKDELKEHLDAKFYKPVLAIPMILVAVFTVLPVLFMIFVAFTNYDKEHIFPSTPFTWVGFENFGTMFDGKALFAKSFADTLGWTLIWAVLATVLNYVFGMILAIMINKKGIKLKKLWRTIFVITIAVPQFVSLMSVSYMLADNGFINSMLTNMGLDRVQFLSNTNIARVTVIIVNLWVGVPYTMLITSGILMNIPEDLYESAKIDGAGPVAQFTRITLPYMLFVTGPYLITQFIGNINNFNVIFFLTGGKPNRFDYESGGTDLLITWLYKITLNESEYKTASILGIFVFAISSFISLLMYNNINATKDEEAFR